MIVYENEELNKAYEIASMAHKNQKDKGGIEYIAHPIAVSKMVRSSSNRVGSDTMKTS